MRPDRGTSTSGTSSAWPASVERARGGQLEVPGALEMADPDRAVHGRAADGAVPLRDDLTGLAAQCILGVDAEQVELGARDRVEDARVAFGGADAAHDRGGRVRVPVDRAVALPHHAGAAGL